jgi:hypothetical protein
LFIGVFLLAVVVTTLVRANDDDADGIAGLLSTTTTDDAAAATGSDVDNWMSAGKLLATVCVIVAADDAIAVVMPMNWLPLVAITGLVLTISHLPF